MKKITLLTLSLSFLIILPATAQLGKVWTDFKSYSQDLQTYFTDNVNNDTLKLELQSEYAVPNVTGEFKIPNPFDAGENDRFINSISDKFENNPAVRSTLVSNERNRLITRSLAAGILGVNGQNRSKHKLENTERRLQNIGVFDQQDEIENNQLFAQIPGFIKEILDLQPSAGSAISKLTGATQLQSLKIQQEQTKIVAETLGQTIQTNQSLQYTNLNLASLSQQMEDTNRSRRVDASAEAARLLRTTSQTDLFGRENK